MEKIKIYDTTLRDGNQGMGISLSLKDKLAITKRLDDFGVDYIEGGWPNATNPTDIEFYKEVAKLKLKNSRIAAFGSTRRPGKKCDKDILIKYVVDTDAPVFTLFGKSWNLHVTEVIRTTLEENLAMINESVAFLKKRCDEVIYDAEHFFDGYNADKAYALKTLMAAQDAGADAIVLCDTNGGMLPMEMETIVKEIRAAVKTPLGIHTHNDSGNAVANTLIAVANGAVHVQGVVNGFGERCGNANLCSIVPDLLLKMEMPLSIKAEKLKDLTSLSIFVSEMANIAHDIRQPFVGEAAFSHKGGMHIDAVIKVSQSFEHTSPELVGNKRQYLVSDQAGKSTVVEKLKNIMPEIKKTDPIVEKILDRVKSLEREGYQFEAANASFKMLALRLGSDYAQPFIIKSFRIIDEMNQNGEKLSEGTVRLIKDGKEVHTASQGNGPVHALSLALRKALEPFYPELKIMHLADYKVRVLEGSAGTDSKVRVWVSSTDGEEDWRTVGVSTNIIEASWLALIDSIEYFIYKTAQLDKKFH